MPRQQAVEQYTKAMKLGLKEVRERTAAGLPAAPAVLDELIENAEKVQYVGVVEIPMERVVGTKTAGRVSAFSPSFYPLLGPDTEFANKWVDLCQAHLEDGIRDPIRCYEYMGWFYVQEGNKRVSVLKSFDAMKIPGEVNRIQPRGDEPNLKAYQEFIEFYRTAKLYDIQFKEPGGYAKLLKAVGKEPGQEWTQQERRTLSAYYHYFCDAFRTASKVLKVGPEEAFLRWLQVYSYRDLGNLSAAELKKTVNSMWPEIAALTEENPVEVHTEKEQEVKPGLISNFAAGITKLVTAPPEHLNLAFVHTRNPQTSEWVLSHQRGCEEMQGHLGEKVTVRSYFDCDSPEKWDEALQKAVDDGADVIFTTAVQMTNSCLKLAVKYPKLRVYNCSVNMPYPSIRNYYSRLYEAKFLAGAVAGAMAKDGRIGYIGTCPIFGELASINAFTLGAQLTNPRARVQLEWSCLPGNCLDALMQSGAQVISNRDAPVADELRPFYGTFLRREDNSLVPLATPCCMWGTFYTKIMESIFAGKEPPRGKPRAISYWWGMQSGVITVQFTEHLPLGVRHLAQILQDGLLNGTVDPFMQRITAQDGSVRSDGTRGLTPDELLRMDYLVQGVDGSIPAYSEIMDVTKPMVRLLGVFRDEIPAEETI